MSILNILIKLFHKASSLSRY